MGCGGLRIGYAVANPATIALLHKMRPMYEVSTLAVEFMSRMIDKSEEMVQAVARINAGKAFFAQAMCSAGFEVLPGEGNFTHVALANRPARSMRLCPARSYTALDPTTHASRGIVDSVSLQHPLWLR